MMTNQLVANAEKLIPSTHSGSDGAIDEPIIFTAILKGLAEHGITDRAVAASIAKQLDDIGMFGKARISTKKAEEQLPLL